MKSISQIIIIDDNKMDCFINQKISSLLFEKATIKTFSSSVMALDYFKNSLDKHEMISTSNIDLLLIDINMPEMNGFELLKKLEKTPLFIKKAIQVYFLSSSNIKKDINDALNIKSCSGYIVKPLTKDKLINAINTNIQNKYCSLNNNSAKTNQPDLK
ncbi:response regulator [Mariniflexile jejuense]|uniref:Response regulator n=1 Tax=Mariniflexile jejuense TaxID=1173582 RepID=A0ABW3JFQ6_9FLAO